MKTIIHQVPLIKEKQPENPHHVWSIFQRGKFVKSETAFEKDIAQIRHDLTFITTRIPIPSPIFGYNLKGPDSRTTLKASAATQRTRPAIIVSKSFQY